MNKALADVLVGVLSFQIQKLRNHQACRSIVHLVAEHDNQRLALPNSEIMIHQPSSGVQGQATDMKIRTDWVIRTREKLNRIMSEQTGQPLEVIERDTERDRRPGRRSNAVPAPASYRKMNSAVPFDPPFLPCDTS